MKYIVFGDDGKEYGPVDGETLRKWAEMGRVLPGTQVRNAMMKKWNKAEDLDFLKDAFIVQKEKIDEEKGAFEHGVDFLKSIFVKKKGATKKDSTFRYTYLPEPSPLSLRLSAFVFDLILIIFYLLILSLIFSLALKAGMEPTPVFTLLFLAFFTGVVMYYGISLGLYAQTFGMWFWGIMIVSSNIDEVFLGRAYFHTLMMIVFGILTPIFVYLNPVKRSLHEYISGTKIILIAAKPKA